MISPESVMWIKREQVYRSLVEYKLGCNKKQGESKESSTHSKDRTPLPDIFGAAEDSSEGM
jgi:hypothetical protein